MDRSITMVAVLGAALFSVLPARAEPAPHGSAEAGKAVFQKVCYTCHGTTGQGAVTGPRIGPPPLPFDAFVAEVRSPARQMVPFPPTILSDQDLADIYAFLQTQPKEDYRQIPLLNQSR